MSGNGKEDVTTVLHRVGQGDRSAAERLLPLVYDQLKALAGGYFRGQAADHTLQPTALVHEAFLKMVDQSNLGLTDRAHFFAVAALAMRQILADHARKRRAAKRGGDWQRVAFDPLVTPPMESQIDSVVLDDALSRLAELNDRKHRVVLLRFFGGLSLPEIAEIEDVSLTTIEGDWRGARAWLSAELSRGGMP